MPLKTVSRARTLGQFQRERKELARYFQALVFQTLENPKIQTEVAGANSHPSKEPIVVVYTWTTERERKLKLLQSDPQFDGLHQRIDELMVETVGYDYTMALLRKIQSRHPELKVAILVASKPKGRIDELEQLYLKS